MQFFCCDEYCCYYVMLLFLFSFNCCSTITDEQQEQKYSTVTATTTRQINLHKFLNVQELISYVQFLLNCIVQNVKLIYYWSWPWTACNRGYICLCNVKMTLCSTALGHQMPLPGGTSDCNLPSQLHSSTCQTDLV